MRKIITLLLAVVALSATAQISVPNPTGHLREVMRSDVPIRHFSNPNRSVTNVSIDYDSFDRYWAATHASNIRAFAWPLNNRATVDSIYTLDYAVQTYDTLIDVNSSFAGTARQGATTTLDSFDLVLLHDNVSGQLDTFIVTVFDKTTATVTGSGVTSNLSNGVLWADTIIFDADFFATDTDFYGLTYRPNVTLPAGHTAGIKVEFRGPIEDMVEVIASFRQQCGAANFSTIWADTNKIAPRNSSFYLNNAANSGFVNYSTNLATTSTNACKYFVIQNFWIFPYFTVNTASGSVCTPDAGVTSGMGPQSANVPCIQQGVPFNQTYTFVIPQTAAGGAVTVTSVRFDSIVNLPAGLSVQYSHNPPTYPGGSTGCFLLSGTTTAACDQYWMKVYVTIVTNALPVQGEISDLATQYAIPGFPKNFLRVVGAGGTCPAVNASQTAAFVAGSCGTVVNITASITKTDVQCFSESTGSATANGSGGSNYTYVWNTGATIQTINNLPAGTYTVTVTSGNATATASTTINAPASGVSTGASATTTTCGQSTGTATVNPTGGTPGYTYLWSTGATTATISNLSAGNYTVTVSDSHSCNSTATVQVTTPNGPSATATPTNANCAGGTGGITLTVTGGTGNITYHWNNNATTQNLSNVVAGTYTVTVNDANNCSFTVASTVTAPTAIVVTGSTTNTSGGQNNGAVNITATGGTGSFVYHWSNNASSEDISNVAANTYTVTVTDQNNCTATASFTVAGSIGINNVDMVNNFSVFPNPATTSVNVQIALTENADMKVELVDLTGKVIVSENAGKVSQLNYVMNTSTVPTGVYAIRVSGSKFSVVRQVTIAK